MPSWTARSSLHDSTESDRVDVSLLVVDVLEELILVCLGRDDLAVLSDGLLELTVDLKLSESHLLACLVSQVEDAPVVLAGVASPHRAGLVQEVLLDLHVPVLVLTIELEVLSLGHVVNSQDTVIAIHGQVLNSGNWGRDHLFEVVDFIYTLGLTPEAIRAVNEDEILITVVNHLANVVEVDVLEESQD